MVRSKGELYLYFIFPTKSLQAPHLSPIRAKRPEFLSVLALVTRNYNKIRYVLEKIRKKGVVIECRGVLRLH